MTRFLGRHKKKAGKRISTASRCVLIVGLASLSCGAAFSQGAFTGRWSVSKMVDRISPAAEVAVLADRMLAVTPEPEIDAAGTPLSAPISGQASFPCKEEALVSCAELSETEGSRAHASNTFGEPDSASTVRLQTVENQAGTVTLQLEGRLLSVHARNITLSNLFRDLARRCNIHIFSPEVLETKVVSANFHKLELEEAIKTLMRISGVGNYALLHRNDLEGRCSVSQIFFFPSGLVEEDLHNLEEPAGENDSQRIADHPEAFPDELPDGRLT